MIRPPNHPRFVQHVQEVMHDHLPSQSLEFIMIPADRRIVSRFLWELTGACPERRTLE